MTKWLRRLSLVSRGGRHQVGIAIALITVVPALAMTFLAMDSESARDRPVMLNRGIIMGS